MLARVPSIAVFAVTLSLAARCTCAQLVSQNFESWPETGTVWTNATFNNWLLNDGQVRPARGGHAPPIGAKCGWLNDFDATSNTWIQSPLMAYGVDTVRFQMRRKTGGAGEQLFAIETSPDATNWTTQQTFDRVDDDWSEASHRVNTLDPVYVRIVKFSDQGTNEYLGLDNIDVIPPPGVVMTALQHQPASPTASTLVHVFVNAEIADTSSNVVLRTWYRFGTAGAFTAITMTNLTNELYRTQSPIPSGFLGTVQYYVECTYSGFGVSPLFAPEPGSNGPAIYSTANPYLNTALRQLSPSSHRTPLIVSELMYNPGAAATGTLTFVELFNTEPIAHDLSGFRLAGDVAYTFPTGTLLAARTFMVVAADPAAVAAHYGIEVFGPLTGGLPNGGGTVQLRNREGALLLETEYDDDQPWPLAADGGGHSLTLAMPDYGENDPQAWLPSRFKGGSPGYADPLTNSPLDAVLINEFLAHTDLPDIDHVELFNTATQSVDISGCTLSDALDTPKFTVPPGTILPPLGFIAFSQTNLGFSLSSHGDEIVLGAADHSRIVDALRFPAQANGVAMGRLPDGTAMFTLLAAHSPGAANNTAGARHEDVVINEVMYHPISGLVDDEYVELLNTGSNTVDVGSWRFTAGIDFAIPPGTTIPAGGFLVIARDAERLRTRYPHLHATNTVGNYTGQLSDRGERLALARPDDPLLPNEDFVPVDELTYNDGDAWGRWADGGGSSLELIDARADNALPMNWAGSDESAKAPWTTVDLSGTVDNGTFSADQLRVLLFGAGECLLDNVNIAQSNGPVLLDAGFESGLAGWIVLGNHWRTSLDDTGGFGGGKCLHLRASDTGNEGHWSGWNTEPWLNHVRTPLSGAATIGSTVRIQARLRWLAGWPHLVLALRGYWLDAAVELALPETLGSPGLANSRARANTGPAIGAVTHSPILPAPNQPAIVSCRVDDPDGLAAVTLRYRLDPDTNLASVAMNDAGLDGDVRAGDGRYSGAIPGQSLGVRVAFTINAVDAHATAQTNAFPLPPATGAPASECVLRFGQVPPIGVLGHYTLWMTDAAATRWTAVPGGKYSNEPQDCTFVYGNHRVIYSAGARWRGLWRNYSTPPNSGGYSVELPKSDRLLGTPDFDLDQIGQNGGDSTRQAEGYCFWLARDVGVPAPYVRYTRVNVNGNDRGLLHDLQNTGADLCESWYGDDDPAVFKITGWVGDPFSPYVESGTGRRKQSRYRWLLDKRGMREPNDDFSPVYAIVDAAGVPDNAVYDARMKALLDVRRWTGFFAVCGATAAWDHYGWSYTHNGLLYLPRNFGASHHLYDMDHVLSDSRALFPSASWPVPYRMFNRPEFRRVYLALLESIANGPMLAQHTDARMDALYNALLANGGGVTAPSGLKAWVANYRIVVSNAVAPYAAPFAIFGEPDIAATNPLVTLAGTAPVAVDTIRINGVKNVVSYPTVTNWSLRVGLAPGTNALWLTAHDWRGALIASNALTVTVNAPAPDPQGQVVISEIMYHPPIPEDEYVELYNRSATASFDLRGWRLNGADLVFDGGSILGPKQFAVAAANLPAYQHAYGNAEVVLGRFAGTLDNGGETLALQRPTGSNAWETIDSVTYDDDPPWPQEAKGNGQALQVIDLNQSNDQPANWGVISTAVTPTWKFKSVTAVVSNGVPGVLNQARVFFHLAAAGTVLVDRVSLVTGTVAETGSNLLANGSFETALTGPWSPMGNHTNSALSTNAHSGSQSLALTATGPGGPALTNLVLQPRPLFAYANQTVTLSYWYHETPAPNTLTAVLSHSSVATAHSTAPPAPETAAIATPGTTNTTAATLPELPALWINEVMPSNTTAWADNQGDFDPWIELYNHSTNPVALADYRLSHAYDDPGRWAFPTDAVIQAGAHLLIWADNEPGETDAGNLHANFTLNATTGSVLLARAWFGQHLVLDALDYQAIGANFSYGSYPEGAPQSRQVFHTPTPGTANTPASLPVQVRINEWMSDNEGTLQDPTDNAFDDWFELYNPGSQPVNLGGYHLTDNLSDPDQFTIPGGTVIAPGAHLLVWADNSPGANAPNTPLHTNFRLSNNGEALGLYKPDGTALDTITFGPQAGDEAEGRWPDGAASLYAMAPPTPGSSNRVLQVTSLPPAGPGGAFSMSWAAESGMVYDVLGATNLVLPGWHAIGTVTASAPAVLFTDTNAPAFTNRFYKLQRAE